MDSETHGSDPRGPSGRHPADPPPCPQNSLAAKGSEEAQKPRGGKEEIISSPCGESRTQRPGSEPKTHDDKSEDAELQRDSGISGSESEGRSRGKGPRKRKISSSDSAYDGAGASLADERSVTPGKKPRRTPDEDRGGEGKDTSHERPKRRGVRGAGRSGRRRHRSPGDQPPPLRKRLVTALRALSEAIYEDVAQACEQGEHCPLTWEQRSGLGVLYGPLYSALQTLYTMAQQAAYVFPAESWLVPGPPPPQVPGAPAWAWGPAWGPPGQAQGPAPPQGRS